MDSRWTIERSSGIETHVKSFYDKYWPSHLPTKQDLEETRQHLYKIIPHKRWEKILDAGCGLGVCTVALSDIGVKVVGLDISPDSLRAAETLANKLGKQNIEFQEGNLMDLPYEAETFDLILCWGVLMSLPSAEKAFSELARCLRKDGTLVVAVLRKSPLTPVHDTIRRICFRLPRFARRVTIKVLALFTKTLATVLNRTPARDDLSFEAKVEDFYFVPFKRFFSVAEMRGLFEKHGMGSEVLLEYTGRFKSTSSFIVRGTRY